MTAMVVSAGQSQRFKAVALGYRFDGKEKLMALGEYPVVTLAQVRERHFAARKKLAAGTDPMAERKADAEAKHRENEAQEREDENSFENIARKWWEWWAAGKSPRHADYVLRRLEADVFPAFGHKFIDSVIAADIRQLMLGIEVAARGTLRSEPTRLRGRFSGLQLLMEWQNGIPPLISSPATFCLKPRKRTFLGWMPKSYLTCC